MRCRISGTAISRQTAESTILPRGSGEPSAGDGLCPSRLVGVMGAALGALLRSVAGGISVLVAALMLIPGLMSLRPSSWQDNISPYLPGSAGEAMYALTHDATTLSPTAGLLVFLGWTVLALAGAAYRLVRRDVR
jgi:ABC-2 type transport system permease protein